MPFQNKFNHNKPSSSQGKKPSRAMLAKFGLLASLILAGYGLGQISPNLGELIGSSQNITPVKSVKDTQANAQDNKERRAYSSQEQQGGGANQEIDKGENKHGILDEMGIEHSPRSSIRVQAHNIHDGDTLWVHALDYPNTKDFKVRLIGIDAPELHGNQSKKLGGKATGALARMVKRGPIYLQFDKQSYDKYGRVLAYIWLDEPDDTHIENSMVNLMMVAQGYAEKLEVKPNLQYSKEIAAAQERARSEKRGFWSAGDFRKFPND